MSTPIVIAKKTTDTTQDIVLHSQFANRHGLIAGATGTGKTVTLKVLAESFSRLGIPVFLADAKGDVSSLAKVGSSSPKFDERFFGIYLGNKVILFVPQFQKLVRYFWHKCSISTTRKKAYLQPCFALQMIKVCCSSTLKI